MKEKSNLFGLWTYLSTIAVVASTTSGAGWIVGRTYLKDEIEQYKESSKWRTPEAIKKISALSSSLDTKLKALEDYEQLKKYKHKAQERIDKINKDRIASEKEFKDKIIEMSAEHELTIEEYISK